MNLSILRYLVLILGLQGCQLHSHFISDKVHYSNPSQFEQLARYGSNFAKELTNNPKLTCDKYIRLHQAGDWRASWVLALTVAQSEKNQCLNINDAILVLTTLESQYKIKPDLIWLNQSYLQLLYKLQDNESIISQLNKTIRDSRKKTTTLKEVKTGLEEEKEDLTEKIEALKKIETNINK